MTRRAALLGLVLALLGPAAQANTPQEDRMLSTASAYWGTEASCPSASIAVTHDLPHADGEMAWASVGACAGPSRIIRIDEALDVRGSALCQVIVHEYGHLIGQEHSTDPASVMYANPLAAVFAPCRSYEPRPKKCADKRYRRSHARRCLPRA